MNKYLIPAHRLPEYDVVNSAGEDLGQAQEFMIDMTTGHVAYVVVAFGGTLGLSDKWLAMPFDAHVADLDANSIAAGIEAAINDHSAADPGSTC